jgi:hypothetical protein
MSITKTYPQPDFDVPVTFADARERILLLSTDIASIDDQIEVRKADDNLDPEWLKKASTSRRFKLLERGRLENWITNMTEAREGYRTLNDAIVEIVKDEFTPEERGQITAESENNLASGRLGGTMAG